MEGSGSLDLPHDLEEKDHQKGRSYIQTEVLPRHFWVIQFIDNGIFGSEWLDACVRVIFFIELTRGDAEGVGGIHVIVDADQTFRYQKQKEKDDTAFDVLEVQRVTRTALSPKVIQIEASAEVLLPYRSIGHLVNSLDCFRWIFLTDLHSYLVR